MKIANLDDVLKLVPEYWPLNLKLDTFKDGDIYVLEPTQIGLRPIPLEIRTQEARWILLSAHSDFKMSGCWGYGCEFDLPTDLESFGGRDQVESMLTQGPGVLWRWVAESRT